MRLEDCEPIWADPMHPVAVGGACEHGPLLLFEKFPGPKQFWGCSACRNPKTDCPDGKYVDGLLVCGHGGSWLDSVTLDDWWWVGCRVHFVYSFGMWWMQRVQTGVAAH